MILGDVVAIASYYPEGELNHLVLRKDNIQRIFIPISSEHLLIGEEKKGATRLPSIHAINEAVATLSRNFFICRNENNYLKKLAKQIGTKLEILPEEKVLEFQEKLEELF